MSRTLLRMERPAAMEVLTIDRPPLRRWERSLDHGRIPAVYAEAFGSQPWDDDWDRFDEFDADGVFVAEHDGVLTGFGICFPRDDFGYISVVAVVPAHRRRGIASAIVVAAIDYLRSSGVSLIRIDAYADAPAAVATYRSLGFEVYATKEDDEADPRGTAEE